MRSPHRARTLRRMSRRRLHPESLARFVRKAPAIFSLAAEDADLSRLSDSEHGLKLRPGLEARADQSDFVHHGWSQ